MSTHETPAAAEHSTFSGPPAPTVWPTLGFTDIAAAFRLITEGFGFVVTTQNHAADGTLDHAEARWPDGGGIMFSSRGKLGVWGTLGPQGVYVAVADAATVDAIWNRLQGWDGLEVINALEDADYGSHTFGVRDGDGNLWSFGTYRGA